MPGRGLAHSSGARLLLLDLRRISLPVNASPLMFTDPMGLFVPANHNGITAEALQRAGSLCPDLPGMVALADFLPGSQATRNSHWHAMSNGEIGESASAARAKYEDYVK